MVPAAPPGEKKERKKPEHRRAPRRAVPDGHKEVIFHIPNDVHAQAKALADADERETVDDLARVIFARHVRNHNKGGGST